MNSNKIELLAPAKDLECGIEAINHGADAVYIGAPQYSARSAAGNSIADIESLCKYAHQFKASVHVALNTILFDNELQACETLINELYNCGIDALIIQDLGILKLDLPPIALHASTQMDNRSVEKIQTIEKLGFQRAILARELSLQEIKNIKQNSNIELEAFVHGSLCVSYSGQCYMSEIWKNRSANRGNCAQLCRLPYSLYDADNKLIVEKKHLLSLKDMDRSDYLSSMMDAGISSFKIEGRLKDVDYVKNITAFYRQKIDEILAEKCDYSRASFGKSTFFFQPNPEKTFHRSKTDYLLQNDNTNIFQFNTPKSIGSKLGNVVKFSYNYLIINTKQEIHNGDGLVFFDEDDALNGFRVNKVEGEKIYPLEMPHLQIGQTIYRNFDHQWNKQLMGKSAERKLALDLNFSEKNDGFSLELTDETGKQTIYPIECNKELARNGAAATQQIQQQLKKLGNTIYYARKVEISTHHDYFIPISKINEWRNEAIMQLIETKTDRKSFPHTGAIPHLFDNRKATYLSNIVNDKSREVLSELGYSEIDWGYEREKPIQEAPVMFCKHCIKKALGFCSKSHHVNSSPREPWIMKNRNIEVKLEFDCAKCEMRLIADLFDFH